MSHVLLYDDRRHRLLIIDLENTPFVVAGNNADSRSRGPWPEGVFIHDRSIDLSGKEAEVDGKFGSSFHQFVVPGRSGMGIHAGRRNRIDGAGRHGPLYATLGCIRTTEMGLQAIRDIQTGGGIIDRLVVVRNTSED